eukprot:564351_1
MTEPDEYPELCNANKALMTRIATEVNECKTGTNEKVDEVKKEVDHIKARIGDSTDGYDETSLHSKLKGTGAKIDTLKNEVDDTNSTIRTIQTDIDELKETVDNKVNKVQSYVDGIKTSISELTVLFKDSRGPTLSHADGQFIDYMVRYGGRIRVVKIGKSLNVSIFQFGGAYIRVNPEGLEGAGFITVLPGNEGQIGVKADEINVCVMRSGQTQFGTVKISNLRKNTHAITGLQATENINIDAVSIAKENEITLLPETLVLNDDSAVVDIRYGNSSECAEGVKLCGFKLGSNCMTDVQACLKKIKSGD